MKALKVTSYDAVGAEDWSVDSMKRTLRDIRRNSSKMLKEIPKRSAFIERVNASEQVALNLMPELQDGSSQRYKQFDAVIRHFPRIKENPNWPQLVAAAVRGFEEFGRAGKTDASSKSTLATAQKPPASPKPAASSGSRPTGAKLPRTADPELRKRVFDPSGGDTEAKAEFLQSFLDTTKG